MPGDRSDPLEKNKKTSHLEAQTHSSKMLLTVQEKRFLYFTVLRDW